MDDHFLLKCTSKLTSCNTDTERFAALLLVTKVLKSEECDDEARRHIFNAVGFQFLRRLLNTDKVPDGCPSEVYKSLAVTLLACFCTDPELRIHPEMLACLPNFCQVITTSESIECENDDRRHLVADCYECLTCIALHHDGRRAMIDRNAGAVNALCSSICHCKYGNDKAWELLECLMSHCQSDVWTDNLSALERLLAHFSSEFIHSTESGRFLSCTNDLCTVLTSVEKHQMLKLGHRSWNDEQFRTVIFQILQHKLGSAERNAVLRLCSLLVDLLGADWLLWPTPDGVTEARFYTLLVHLACIEVRMILEEYTDDPELPCDILVACYQLLENIIAHLTTESGPRLTTDCVQTVHGALTGAINAVIHHLSSVQETTAADPGPSLLVTACVRMLGAWMAEETSALRKDVISLLPFLLQICENNFAVGTTNNEKDDNADDEPTESEKTAPMDLLQFLLPGLCHLTADDGARRVLLDGGLPSLLVRYLHRHWSVYEAGGLSSHEVQVTLTVLCGSLLNLSVLEPDLISSGQSEFDPVISTVISALPKLETDCSHTVLSYNFMVLGLMLIRHKKQTCNDSDKRLKIFFSSCVHLIASAHAADKDGEVAVSETCRPYWTDIAELWFLAVQAVSDCLLFSHPLLEAILDSDWVPNSLHILGTLKQGSLDDGMMNTWTHLLTSLSSSAAAGKQMIDDNGGKRIAKKHKMRELELILNR